MFYCNEIYNCYNGIDELNCPNRNCSFNQYQCLNEELNINYCLSFNQIYEKDFSYSNKKYFNRLIYFINETNNNNTDTNITCIFDIEGNFFNCFNKINNPLSVLKVVEI